MLPSCVRSPSGVCPARDVYLIFRNVWEKNGGKEEGEREGEQTAFI